MEERTPIQKYCDSHGLCWGCQEPYNNCTCTEVKEIDPDYQQILIDSINKEV
jgi:hypothetical protein